MKNKLKELLVIFLLPLVPALFLQSGIRSHMDEVKKVEDKYALSLEKASSLENVLWLDSRKKLKYEQDHISKALHVSFKDWEGSLMVIFENFEPGQNIVVYCNPSCSTSRNLAQKLRLELQQENIFYLKGGFESWQKKSP